MANKDYALVPYKYLDDNFVKKGRDMSWVGFRFMDESLTTSAQVIEKYGGTIWKCLSKSLGVYQWLRTDTPTPRTAYLGYMLKLTRSVYADDLADLFGGYEWTEISDEGGVHQWVCTDYAGGEEKVLQAYVGMIISSPNLPDATAVQDQYGGFWELLGNEDGVYQWQCIVHENPTSLLPSQNGEIIFSASLLDESQVSAMYGGTWRLLSDEDGVFQYERIG